MELNDPLFRITPETFKAVHIDLSSGEPLPMVNPEMPVSTEHEGIITAELVRVHNKTSSYCFNGMVQNLLCRNVSQNFHLYHPLPLQDAENRDLVPGTSAPCPFTSASEIGLISLDLPLEERITIDTLGCDSHANNLEGLQDRGIRCSQLQRCLPCRDLQFKELYEPQPPFAREVEFPDPSPREVSKLIPTMSTEIPSLPDSVDFSVLHRVQKMR